MQFETYNVGSTTGEDPYARIAWYEGLLLLPQHFQMWDERVEKLLRRQMMAAHPYAWGVDRLRLDSAALSAGRLRVLAVAGQLPDGMVFSWSQQAGTPLERNLNQDFQEGIQRYALAVPTEDFNEGGTHVSRYRQFVGAPVADRGNPDEKAAVARWLPGLTIRPWDPAATHYSQLPFAELAKTAGGYELTNYHPPMTRLMTESGVAGEISRLIQTIRTKIEALEVSALPGVLGKEYRNNLRPVLATLTGGLPRLEAQLAGRVAHPYALFLTLCDMAGQVASLTGKAPDLFAPYSHFDPAAALRAATQYISRVVSGIGIDHRKWKEIPCVLKDNRWTCAVPEGVAQPLLFRIAFNPNQTDAAITFWMERTLICWAADEDRNRELRTKGLVRRQSVALSHLGLPAVPAQRYMQLDSGDGPASGSRMLVIDAQGERALAAVNEIRLLIYA